MALETAKDSLVLNQIISQKRDTFMIEDDCIVPDIKPDILNVISSSGLVCIYKKEILDGKIRIDGSVNTYIMYLADSEENGARAWREMLPSCSEIQGTVGLPLPISQPLFLYSLFSPWKEEFFKGPQPSTFSSSFWKEPSGICCNVLLALVIVACV